MAYTHRTFWIYCVVIVTVWQCVVLSWYLTTFLTEHSHSQLCSQWFCSHKRVQDLILIVPFPFGKITVKVFLNCSQCSFGGVFICDVTVSFVQHVRVFVIDNTL
jgi:hypothetical protein